MAQLIDTTRTRANTGQGQAVELTAGRSQECRSGRAAYVFDADLSGRACLCERLFYGRDMDDVLAPEAPGFGDERRADGDGGAGARLVLDLLSALFAQLSRNALIHQTI